MIAVLKLAFATATALGAVLLATAASSSLVAPRIDRTPLRVADNTMIWTAVPTRVDRDNQPYVRIADPYSFTFSARKGVMVLDSATFTFAGETFLVEGIERIDPKAVCVADDSRRLACGQGGRAALRAALRGDVACSRRAVARGVYIARCKADGQDLALRVSTARQPPALLASAR